MKNHVIEPDYIACVELGGVPIGVLVADRTGLPLIIVRKEAKETKYWLNIIKDTVILSEVIVNPYIQECHEIQMIISNLLISYIPNLKFALEKYLYV